MRANEAHANGVCGAGGPRASTFVFLSRSVGEIAAYFHPAESTAEGESLVALNALTQARFSSVFMKMSSQIWSF